MNDQKNERPPHTSVCGFWKALVFRLQKTPKSMEFSDQRIAQSMQFSVFGERPRLSSRGFLHAPRHKKGAGMGDMLFGAVLVALLVFVLLIAFGAKLFFSRSYDTRAAEAELLALRIERCIASQSIAWEKEGALYRVCGLSREVLEERLSETRIGILICEGRCAEGKRVFKLGSNFVVCELRARTGDDAKCAYSRSVSGGKQYEIITMSNHQERVT